MPLGPPTAATKFQPPTPVLSWVERERLTQMLAAGGNKRLALLHGPAGYGKSTLAAQWLAKLAAEGSAVAWFSLDRDDNNTIWFLSHLLESLLKVKTALDPQLIQLLQERPEDAEKYVVPHIINALATSERPTVIALDDWHLITAPRTVAVLERMLDEACENLRFVVTSRTRNGLPLGRLRVRDQLVEVDATSLRFDHQESRQFLVGLNRLDLTADDLAALHESTDGWVAALQLTSLSLRGQDDVSGLVRKISGRHQAIGEYLAENVLDTLEPDVLEFLLSTCITERICADLASTLSGVRRGQAMLEEIQARDLFLQPLDVDGIWFRYHHLFEEYLRRRLERDEPERITGLHRAAAHWYARNGHLSEAVDHALVAGDVEFAVDVVESNAMLKVEHSQMSTLLALVGKLPEDRVTNRPRLQMAVAWANCLLHYPVDSGLALERAESSLGPGSDLDPEAQEELRIEALVVRRCLEMYADRIDTSGDLEERVLAAPRRLRPWIVSVAANISTYDKLHSGRYDEALALQAWARPIHDQTTGPFSGVYGRCFAGLAAFAKLETDAAEQFLAEALELGRRSAGAQSHAARLAGGLLGELFYQRGDVRRARLLLEEAAELGPHGGVVDFMMSTYGTLAGVKAAQGDPAGAEKTIETGEAIADTLGLPRLSLRLMGARAELGMAWHPYPQDVPADPHLREALRQATDTAVVVAALRSPPVGETAAAETVRLARGLLARAEASTNRRSALQARTLLVVALHLAGQQDEAKSELKGVLVACFTTGLVTPITDAGPVCLGIVRSLSDDLDHGRWVPEHRASVKDFLTRVLDQEHNNPAQHGQAQQDQAPLDRSHPAQPHPDPSRAASAAGPSAGNGALPAVLSKRELEILLLLEQGLSNRQIADSLHLGINTVKWYLKNLFSTLGVADRQQCVDTARSLQLLNG